MDDGVYLLPTVRDEEWAERDRLDGQHRIFAMARGSLSPSTMRKIDDAKHALDLGCGTGIWALEFAHNHPQAQVYGVDINPPAPTPTKPDNPLFFTGNVDRAHAWDSFPCASVQLDYIHARLLIAGVHSWPTLFANVAAHLAPGGLFELYEGSPYMLCSEDAVGAETSTPAVEMFNRLAESMAALGLDPTAPARADQMLEEAGLRVVEWKVIDMHLDPDRNAQESQQERQAIADFQVENWATLIAGMTEKSAAFMSDKDAADMRRLAREAEQDLRENGRARGYHIRL